MKTKWQQPLCTAGSRLTKILHTNCSRTEELLAMSHKSLCVCVCSKPSEQFLEKKRTSHQDLYLWKKASSYKMVGNGCSRGASTHFGIAFTLSAGHSVLSDQRRGRWARWTNSLTCRTTPILQLGYAHSFLPFPFVPSGIFVWIALFTSGKSVCQVIWRKNRKTGKMKNLETE